MAQNNLSLTNRRFKWLNVLTLVLACLWLGRAAEAQVMDTFEVGSGNPTGNVNPLVNYLPAINATNFLNDNGGIFSETTAFNLSWPSGLYTGWHYTQNFVNNGEMDDNIGFWFDTQISGHSEAASFNNAGVINCDLGSSNIVINVNLVPYGGGIYLNASNIVNSGTINVGAEGLVNIAGNNLDFTRGTIDLGTNYVVNFFLGNQTYNYPSINAVGDTGRATNGLLVPNQQLTATTARSSYFNGFYAITNLNGSVADYLYVTNSTPYFNLVQTGSSNFLVRAVFLENDNTNVAANVYFGGQDFSFNGCGYPHGGGHVEWVGSYYDPVAQAMATRYLYLDNDYLQGASTNILNFGGPAAGVPCNFTFTPSATQISYGTGPAPSGMASIFGLNQPFSTTDTEITNIYSFVNAQLTSLTYPTNTTTLTNLPGRIQITAANELNLSSTAISGMNYLRLQSTNQFDDDGQSQILSPFSDIYLGCTNGNLALTNVIVPYIPQWLGTVQAWNTKWFYAEGNPASPLFGYTFDYRVLIVGANLSPIASALEKDLILYGTNNVVISDTMNVFGNFSINCTNLLLTTNGPLADSLDGELNFLSTPISWATALPRLRCLTNNGAIRIAPSAVVNFGSTAVPYLDFVNSGVVSNNAGSQIIANDFENYGSFTAGSGSFIAQSQTTTMSNATVTCNGAFTNSGSSVVIGGSTILAGKSLTLIATNLLTDANCTNGNFWALGSAYGGSGLATGLVLPIKPAAGDLLNTVISNTATSGTALTNVWAGKDFGKSNSGYSNNAAIGWLCLDGLALTPRSYFGFSGTGVSNAIYVDCLELRDAATNRDGSGNVTNLVFNTNLVIYYAQAIIDGGSVAVKLDHKNNDHLRWVASYAGRFSSTNLVYPNGTTNAVNAALAADNLVDSDQDGIPNNADSTPFFVTSEVLLKAAVTNLPPKKVKLSWFSIPSATNYVTYRTNLLLNTWQPLTNFISPTNVPPNGVSPTNLMILDVLTNMPRYYRVQVVPNNALYFPPGY